MRKITALYVAVAVIPRSLSGLRQLTVFKDPGLSGFLQFFSSFHGILQTF